MYPKNMQDCEASLTASAGTVRASCLKEALLEQTEVDATEAWLQKAKAYDSDLKKFARFVASSASTSSKTPAEEEKVEAEEVGDEEDADPVVKRRRMSKAS